MVMTAPRATEVSLVFLVELDELDQPACQDRLVRRVIEEHPVKRAISTQPVVKPIKITAPNSVFALGAAFSK